MSVKATGLPVAFTLIADAAHPAHPATHRVAFMEHPAHDKSHGYEGVAVQFMAARATARIGAETVRLWSRTLPARGSVLDLGCGHGVPISDTLMAEGFVVCGVDASPTMIAAFRARFPGAAAECSAVEDAHFPERRFDGVVAWGLFFLLTPGEQTTLIRKVARALKRGGKFLFTAPAHPCEWKDVLTGRTSMSLGADTYRRLLSAEGLNVVGEADDEGENHYYFTEKT